MTTPEIPEKALVEANIMVVDPVAIFMHGMNRMGDPVPEVLDLGCALTQQAGDFLLGLDEAQAVRGRTDMGGLTISGGALKYHSSEGQAFVWLDGTFTCEGDTPVVAEVYILASATAPYDSENQEVLFSLYPEDGLSDQLGRPGNRKDTNFCSSLFNKMKKAYKAPKTAA